MAEWGSAKATPGGRDDAGTSIGPARIREPPAAEAEGQLFSDEA